MTQSSSLRGPSAEALSVLEKQLGSDLGDVGSRKASEVGTNLFALARALPAHCARRPGCVGP
jgi:hypothetical protein